MAQSVRIDGVIVGQHDVGGGGGGEFGHGRGHQLVVLADQGGENARAVRKRAVEGSGWTAPDRRWQKTQARVVGVPECPGESPADQQKVEREVLGQNGPDRCSQPGFVRLIEQHDE